MIRVLPIAVLLLLATSSRAETIYRYLDDGGGVTYTNIPAQLPKKGVEKINVMIPPPPLPGAPGDVKLPGAPVVKVKPTVPINFPKVDSQTQKKRDQSRKQILDDELESEEQSLAMARKALAEGESVKISATDKNHQKYVERLQALKETVSLHEKNVDALKKEIAATK
jgi:Domain of unknown function (DUF4124)